jgi:DNA gyrase/topoisomerase IV subunit A
MKTTIKNRCGEYTFTMNCDFSQILDEHFATICKAIADRGLILKELKEVFEKDEKIIDKIIRIIRKSFELDDAALNLQSELGISEMAAKYILKMPLSDITSLDSHEIEKMLEEYKKQVLKIYETIKDSEEYYQSFQ